MLRSATSTREALKVSSPTWTGEEDYPENKPVSLAGWLRVTIRGLLIVLLLLIGIVVLTLIRLVEKPIDRKSVV